MTPTQLPYFYSLAIDTVKMYAGKWTILLKIVLVFYCLMIGLSLSGFIFAATVLMPIFENKIFFWSVSTILAVLFFLLSTLLSSWLQAAAILALQDKKNELGLRALLRSAKKFALPVFGVNIFTGLAVMSGLLFFVVFGVIFSVWFSLTKYCVVINNKRGIAALIESREYCRGFFWSILLLYLLGFLSLSLVDAIFQTLKHVPVGGSILFLIASAAMWPLNTIYPYLIFNNLKNIKGELPEAAPQNKKRALTALIILTLFAILTGVAILLRYSVPISDYLKKNLPVNLQDLKMPAPLPASNNAL